MEQIKTRNGVYYFKPKILYAGIKKIDRIKAKENLILFNQIANKQNLHFGLCYGTLLGAIRENDFIEHDEDIDLFVLYEHKEHLFNCIYDLILEGFQICRYDRRKELISFIRHGEYIDIYFFVKIGNGLRSTLGDPLPEKYLTELVKIKFQGEYFWVAKDYSEMLLFLYGPEWKTPIQTFNYNSFLGKYVEILKWKIYNWMPNYIFFKLMNFRNSRKMARYEFRIKRMNLFLNKEP